VFRVRVRVWVGVRVRIRSGLELELGLWLGSEQVPYNRVMTIVDVYVWRRDEVWCGLKTFNM
jgi:hypothetical protein